jgi:hypothetical protein
MLGSFQPYFGLFAAALSRLVGAGQRMASFVEIRFLMLKYARPLTAKPQTFALNDA